MRRIQLFRKKQDYERFVFDELIVDPLLRDHPFYRRMVQFVIDAKAPLFYFQSDKTEHANFSAYYHYVLIRETYTNTLLRAMYFLHDFAHLLFYYPHDVASLTREEFDDAVIQSEYAASNETEILIHYRAPSVRERVFQDRRLFFDMLRERGVEKPPVWSLFNLRRQLIESDALDPFFFVKPEDDAVKKQLKSYRGNRAWCKHRLAETLRLPNPTEYFFPFLTPTNYERALMAYESETTQAEYEQTVLKNVRLGFVLMGLPKPPVTFDEAVGRVGELEEKVLVKTIVAEP